MRHQFYAIVVVNAVLLSTPSTSVGAQATSTSKPTSGAAAPGAAAPSKPADPAVRAAEDKGVPVPAGYVIGPDDALSVRFWKDADLSGDVVVRSDGKISLSLLNDVQASGYTPLQLATILEKAAAKYVTDPTATVIVREIRSRKVYVIGAGVVKSGVLQMNGELNVLQALAMSGGLQEYADKDNITIMRNENGREKRYKFNYGEVTRGKNPQQNIALQPNDTILVN
jgi:polysaccharide export outer membrane protein